MVSTGVQLVNYIEWRPNSECIKFEKVSKVWSEKGESDIGGDTNTNIHE